MKALIIAFLFAFTLGTVTAAKPTPKPSPTPTATPAPTPAPTPSVTPTPITISRESATSMTANVLLGWDKSPTAGVEHYRIYWSRDEATLFTAWQDNDSEKAGRNELGDVDQGEAVGLTPGTFYYFSVTCTLDDLESPPSNTVTYTLPGTAPTPTPSPTAPPSPTPPLPVGTLRIITTTTATTTTQTATTIER